MARSPITASKEGDVTSAVEEALQFDDDNLRGEDQHAVSLSCRQLSHLPIHFSACKGNYIEFKPFYSNI